MYGKQLEVDQRQTNCQVGCQAIIFRPFTGSLWCPVWPNQISHVVDVCPHVVVGTARRLQEPNQHVENN
eukprot:Skav205507  [mRNA]  locus=scaffold231:165888:167311:+ [translate_table: standard]